MILLDFIDNSIKLIFKNNYLTKKTMNIADTIYQHVKTMPPTQALKVLQFITNIETKNSLLKTSKSKTDILEFIQKLPIDKKRTDIEINQAFQDLRNEW